MQAHLNPHDESLQEKADAKAILRHHAMLQNLRQLKAFIS